LIRVLVTGASGLLGCKLVDVLSSEYEIIPTHNTHAIYPNSVRMNIVDRNEVLRVLNWASPAVVVHAAGETNVDKCETEKDLALSVNAEGARNIAEACAEIGARLIYISTDYVFDGQKGLYSEEDEPNPVNYYGLTKLKGEEFVKELCEEYVVARTSVIYGWHPKKLNFATWVIDSLRNQRRTTVSQDYYSSPTLADDLADIIRRVMSRKIVGVYHAAGDDRVNRYEFAVMIAQTFGLDSSFLTPVSLKDPEAWIAKRPKDSSLCVDKLKTIGIQPLRLTQALTRMKDSQDLLGQDQSGPIA